MCELRCLALAATLLAGQINGQGWHPIQMLPMRYPSCALIARIQGRVELRFTIDDRGTPEDVTPVRGHPLLLHAATIHLKSLTVRPSGDKPRSVARTVFYSFRLDRAEKSKTDLVSTHFMAPNTVVVTSGFVRPSSPCEALDEKPVLWIAPSLEQRGRTSFLYARPLRLPSLQPAVLRLEVLQGSLRNLPLQTARALYRESIGRASAKKQSMVHAGPAQRPLLSKTRHVFSNHNVL